MYTVEKNIDGKLVKTLTFQSYKEMMSFNKEISSQNWVDILKKDKTINSIGFIFKNAENKVIHNFNPIVKIKDRNWLFNIKTHLGYSLYDSIDDRIIF